MISNVFTKKSSRRKFEKHIKVIVGEDGTPERRVPEEENRSSEIEKVIEVDTESSFLKC